MIDLSCPVQDGTDADEYMQCVTTGAGDTLIMGGVTEGSVSGSNAGGSDIWVAKLDDQGDQMWSLQVSNLHLRSTGQRQCLSHGPQSARMSPALSPSYNHVLHFSIPTFHETTLHCLGPVFL